MTIRVLVSGNGKMGREVLAVACREADLEPVGVVDLFAGEEYISLPVGSGLIPFGSNPAALIRRTRPDVIVDFTNAEWTPPLVQAALQASVRLVIGTSGLPDSLLKELDKECRTRKLGAVVASNFAIGAVLMQYLSRIAGGYFDHAEIIELHHDAKADAPSGTAIATAKVMAEGRKKGFVRPMTQKQNVRGTRGGNVDGITIHSVRLPGLVAHQEVILGGLGETLRIRHDSTSRESFMPGVLLAVRHVMEHPGLVMGLDRLMGLDRRAR
jgi:4-hydroxy-tetrahydrodipicolinate reductase